MQVRNLDRSDDCVSVRSLDEAFGVFQESRERRRQRVFDVSRDELGQFPIERKHLSPQAHRDGRIERMKNPPLETQQVAEFRLVEPQSCAVGWSGRANLDVVDFDGALFARKKRRDDHELAAIDSRISVDCILRVIVRRDAPRVEPKLPLREPPEKLLVDREAGRFRHAVSLAIRQRARRTFPPPRRSPRSRDRGARACGQR